MIRRIQTLNFRCLRHVDLTLGRFHGLIGPNGSGKSALLDAIIFLRDLTKEGLDKAVGKRTDDFRDLVWDRPDRGAEFQLAIEVDIPEGLLSQLPSESDLRVFRYEIAIFEDGGGCRIASERALLMPHPRIPGRPSQRPQFPAPRPPPETILLGQGRAGMRLIFEKSAQGSDSYYVEAASEAEQERVAAKTCGLRCSTLANLPEMPEKFPVATWFKRALENEVRRVLLSSRAMRQPSPPDVGIRSLAADGSNLPWMIRRLRDQDREGHREWMEHVRTMLSDLRGVRVLVGPEDQRAHLILRYESGIEVPSWMASGGTLHFLALTLLAYLPCNKGISLLEKPESSIHPPALEGVVDSLSSIYDAQLLAVTYSPRLVRLIEPREVLCFAKSADGATDIISGEEHPILKNWRGPFDNSVLFAEGTVG